MITTRKVTNKPSLTINVIELLHASTKNKSALKVMTPIVKQESVKREIGQRIIDSILERTLSGNDKNNKVFKNNKGKTGYSDSYAKSATFKIYGKRKGHVDLKLTGEMQADIDVRSIAANTVTIGFTNEMQGVKARGHIEGANYLPKRDFWGIPKEDLIKIMNDVVKEYANEEAVYDLELSQKVTSEIVQTLNGEGTEIDFEAA